MTIELSPDYNSDYLTAERTLTIDGGKIYQYHHNKRFGTYAEILGVDSNNSEQCSKLVMLKVPPEEDVYKSQTINAFWDKLNQQNKFTYYWLHIVVQQKDRFFVACVDLDSDGIFDRRVRLLAYDCRWHPEYYLRFLLPTGKPLVL